MEEQTLNRLLYLLVCVVLYLFYGEVKRAWESREQAVWEDRYIEAVKGGPEEWAFGWRLEDLEARLHTQRHWADSLKERVSMLQAGIDRSEAEVELSGAIHEPSLVTIRCMSRRDRLVQVGPDEFRDMSDRCRAFSYLDTSMVGPHALWETVPLLDGDAVALRSASNGLFLRVKAPADDEAIWNAPWLLETVSPLPGLAERFQLRKSSEDDDSVVIYSELMRGYLQCAGEGVSEPVRGFAGESVIDFSLEYSFNLSKPTPAVVSRSLELLEASRHARALRVAYDKRLPKRSDVTQEKLKVALVVPMTSRGTEMENVQQSPFWFNLFASFVESVDWHKNKHEFTFYLGFDLGDSLYDTGDAWSEMRVAFKDHAKKALRWLGYGNWTVRRVVDAGRSPGSPPDLSLRLFHFDDTLGAPSQVVSGLARQAVADGADYVYQLNDDTILVSKNWLDILVGSLRSSPLAPNLGVAGPLDTTNERILTHAFVHRTHVDIFNAMFPVAFRNWWSDDWISAVYGSRATFARKDVVVTHNVQSQKTGAWNRYDVDHSAQHLLHDEVQRGFVVVNTWLSDRGYPTMPLPYICGYSPMMTRIYDTLMRHGL